MNNPKKKKKKKSENKKKLKTVGKEALNVSDFLIHSNILLTFSLPHQSGILFIRIWSVRRFWIRYEI